jgi:hypothetical protein
VIALPHDFPATPAERPDDRNDAAGPGGTQCPIGRRAQPDTSSPGHAELVALVRLLARQAAEADVRVPEVTT